MDTTPNLDALSGAMECVSTEVMRAAGIIRHLREFVRGCEPHRANVDVGQLLSQVIDLLQPLARDKGVTLERELEDDLPPIEADPVQVEQVVVNLVANAMDAVSDLPVERRSVVLGARLSEADVVEIAVRDRGSGIAKEWEGKLFEAFTTTKEDGLGMGLAISRSIVHSHGGKIWFVHNEPHGAAFQFTLRRVGKEQTHGH
jgi:C4-dicarboxylate-specific signal transduction histidine kinase